MKNLRNDAAPHVNLDMSIPEISQSVAATSLMMSEEEERNLVIAENNNVAISSIDVQSKYEQKDLSNAEKKKV